jgi:hypothetical protein
MSDLGTLLNLSVRLPAIASYYPAPEAAFEDVDPAHARRDLERLIAEQEAARRAVAGLPLDAALGRDVAALGNDADDRRVCGPLRPGRPDP